MHGSKRHPTLHAENDLYQQGACDPNLHVVPAAQSSNLPFPLHSMLTQHNVHHGLRTGVLTFLILLLD
jgi:hypothetical protein